MTRQAGTRERIAQAGPRRHLAPVGPPFPGSAHAVVAGVPCAALPLPSDWAAQANLGAVADAELVEVASAVTTWLAAHGHAGWQLEVDAGRATAVAAALGLRTVREHEVWVSATEPAASGADPVEVVPPAGEEEFLGVFGPELVPMVRGQLGRPDWEVGVVRDGDRSVGCFRLIDLADTTYLGGVTVVPSHRGRGFGRALSAEVTRRARARSDLVWLHCEPGLGPFYAALGYRRLGSTVFLGPGRP